MTEFTFAYSSSPYFWMDPRSKGILFLASNFAIWGGVNYWVSAAFFFFVLLMLINGKQMKMAMTSFVVYFLFLAIDIFWVSNLTGILGVLLLTVFRVARMYMPAICSAVFLIRTTTVSEFVAAFTRMGISEKIIIPFSVMFRFFPTLGEEWKNIRNAMKLRGIQFGFKAMMTKPMETLEYMLVPLLMSTVKISNELSAASVSRGLGGSKKRTCFKEIHFTLLDYVVVALSVTFVVFAIVG